MIQLADTFAVPLDLITQKTAILARTGAGKTNAAVVIAEDILQAGHQIVVIDPKGDWWGLRSSADGKRAGYPVTVLGGEHGDVPLEPSAGLIVADLVVDQPVSVVLDVSEFSNAQRGRFVADFADRFYRHKSHRPDPVLLILEEADEVCPQRVFGEQAKMVGAIERIVKRGRFKGIGTLMITQRSASLNKDILTQTEVLIVMQTTGPQDIKAIDAWIEHHPDQKKRAQLLAEVGTLKQGEAFLWSPSWLDEFTRFRFRMRNTFDAGRTPRVGERRVAPKVLAFVDLDLLREQMAATIERAKADDPVELRRRILELEKALKAKPTAEPQQRVEVPVLTEKQHDTLKGVMGSLDRLAHLIAGDVTATFHQVESLIRKELAPALARVAAPAEGVPSLTAGRRGMPTPTVVVPVNAGAIKRPETGGEKPDGLRRMLIALAQRPTGLTTKQLGIRAQLAAGSGTFSKYLAVCRKEGWVDGSPIVKITEAGVIALGPYHPLPTGRDLLAYWSQELGAGSARMLAALAAAYPKSLRAIDLAEQAGLAFGSGTFSAYLGKLRALELVTGRAGEVTLSAELVDGA